MENLTVADDTLDSFDDNFDEVTRVIPREPMAELINAPRTPSRSDMKPFSSVDAVRNYLRQAGLVIAQAADYSALDNERETEVLLDIVARIT